MLSEWRGGEQAGPGGASHQGLALGDQVITLMEQCPSVCLSAPPPRPLQPTRPHTPHPCIPDPLPHGAEVWGNGAQSYLSIYTATCVPL